jgi:phosphatidylglycerol---prolipoprotein diacylglyceryl transferase
LLLHYPHINPIAFSLGPLKVHWYGIMYLLGFAAAWVLCTYRSKRIDISLTTDQVGDLIFYAALGVILGGRIGYILFYDFMPFVHQPWTLFQVWDGGMSFHGGLIGVLLALWLYSRKLRKPFLFLTDFVAPVVPIGLGLGRIGNFINGELWGRVAHAPWAMVFPLAGKQPRHPSQIYEFLLEGVLLFIILWCYSRRERACGAISGLFLLGYGAFRFTLEFFRQPDPQLGFVAFGWMTRGQELSIPMFIAGALLLGWALKPKNKKDGV